MLPIDSRLKTVGARRLWLVRHVSRQAGMYFVAIAFGAAMAGIAWVRGFPGLFRGALAVCLGALGVVLWARVYRRRAIDELRASVSHPDPGDSPVAWISSETWRREQSFRPGDVYGILYGNDRFTRDRCLDEPTVHPVSPADREAAPIVAPPPGAPVPGAGTQDQHQATLEDPPIAAGLWINMPQWPACCDRLTTLVGLEEVDEIVRSLLPVVAVPVYQPGGKRGGSRPYGRPHLDEGDALFHCRACGRVYLGSYHV